MTATRSRSYSIQHVPDLSYVNTIAVDQGTQAGRSYVRSWGRKRQAGPSKMKRKIKQWDNRKVMPRVTGRGDYKTNLRSLARMAQSVGRELVPKGTFSKLGSQLGGRFGSFLGGGDADMTAAGNSAGKYAGDSFAQMIGFGDYQVKANSLMDLPMGQQVASFGNMSNATVIKHREFIRNIHVPSGVDVDPRVFKNLQLQLNPGLASVFPWLSSLAGNYQEYQFIGCIFEFRSTCSDSATVLPLGSVIIASNYDTADVRYYDKRQMQNSQFCVSAKPSKGLIHPIECDPKVTFVPIKYIRTHGLPDGTDVRLYDHCNVQIATEGLPTDATGSIGELWVSYEVALYKPCLGVTLSLRDHFYNTTGVSTAAYFGTSTSSLVNRTNPSSILGCTLGDAGIINLPAGMASGVYYVLLRWTGTAAFVTTATTLVTTYSDLTAVTTKNLFINDSVGITNDANTSEETALQRSFHFEVLDSLSESETITITGITFASNPTSFEIFIQNCPVGQL